MSDPDYFTKVQITAMCKRFGLDVFTSVTSIEHGSTNAVFMADDSCVIKVNIGSPAGGGNVVKEAALYGALPSDIPLPAVLGVDDSREIIGQPYLILTKIPGELVEFYWEKLSEPLQTSLRRDIARVLGTIHKIKDGKVSACIGESPNHGFANHGEDVAARAKQILRTIRDRDLLSRSTQEKIHAYVEGHPVAATAAPALLHGTFNFRNLLGDGGKLNGVIDWDLASIGCASEELAMVVYRFFPDSLDEFVAAYKEYNLIDENFMSSRLVYPLLYYLKHLPEIERWHKYPGKQRYFRNMTQHILKETIG